MAENARERHLEMQKSLRSVNFFTVSLVHWYGWVLLVGDWMVLGGGPFPAMIIRNWRNFPCTWWMCFESDLLLLFQFLVASIGTSTGHSAMVAETLYQLDQPF